MFATQPQRTALVWSLLLGYLFLPSRFGINLPGLPPLEKRSVAALAILAGLLLFLPNRTPRLAALNDQPLLENHNRLFAWVFFGLAAGLFLNMGLTIATNQTSYTIGEKFLAAMRPWDFVSMASAITFTMIPFFLGRRYLARPEDHRYLLKCLVISGLIYSVLVVFEIRMSPQLHRWIYGYFQSDWVQHFRNGFRPIVFLNHGLAVGFFLFSTVFAALALARSTQVGTHWKWGLAATWLLLVLLISRNLGATAIALLLLALLFLGRRFALFMVTVITLTFLLYPAVRQTNLIPLSEIASTAGKISADRMQSFQFRLDNEDLLLARAAEKPVSGWGSWGRPRVYNDKGRDISVTDGLWIIVLGERGWLGYICFFGLLTLPLLALPRVRKRKEIPIETVAMAVIMAGNLIYLIPNSTLSPIAWLMAGALAGFVQFDVKAAEDAKAPVAKPSRPPGYSRFPAGASVART
ncbi:MAG: hypothetical protein CML66_28110 [Rhodobacteraceae bacterium]|nr:hypothetical protein [Paracoccaceae bacterium]MAY47694.1 hypothetical protein [Paracoccaceae bacterium]